MTEAQVGERGLKAGWRMVKFGDIAENVAARVDPAEVETDVYVGLEHLDPETIHLREWGHPSEVTGDKLAFEKGDVIFGRRRAYQRKLAMAEFGGICSAHAMVIRAKPEMILPEFLPFFLQSDMFMERAIEISVGSLSPTVNWKTLRVQEFPLPPIEEQKRIAEILWAADEAMERYETSTAALDSVLDSIRSDLIWAHKDNWTKLGTVLNKIIGGKSLVGINEPATTEQVGVLKVSAIGRNGFVSPENKRLINQEEFLPQFQVRQDSLLITRCNTADLVGRVCLTDTDYPNLMLSDKTLELVLDETAVEKVFIFEALRSRKVRNQIMGFATGTGGAMKNISQQEIRSLDVPVPSIDEQGLIANKIRAVYEQQKALDLELATLRDLRKKLSAELIPQDEIARV